MLSVCMRYSKSRLLICCAIMTCRLVTSWNVISAPSDDQIAVIRSVEEDFRRCGNYIRVRKSYTRSIYRFTIYGIPSRQECDVIFAKGGIFSMLADYKCGFLKPSWNHETNCCLLIACYFGILLLLKAVGRKKISVLCPFPRHRFPFIYAPFFQSKVGTIPCKFPFGVKSSWMGLKL